LEILDSKAEQTQVDRNVKKLFGREMFLLLLMSVLENERVSLRVMEDLYNSNKFQFFAGQDSKRKTKFTSLSDRLINIKAEFFEELFKATYQILSKNFKAEQIKKHSIVRFDSTCISASAKLLHEGMVNGSPNTKTKQYAIRQIKFTIGFDGLLATTVNVYSEQKYLAEDISLGETILAYGASKKSIAVFDRGLKKRITFGEFSKQDKFFVTRINPTKSYQIISTNEDVQNIQSESLELISDHWVYLFHQDKIKFKVPFRLIQAKQKQEGQLLFFVTNIKELDALTITEIYKSRWDIEVFFRFLKQEMNLKHFASFSLNGIKVMLYIQLIASMLIMLYKKFNNIDGYKRAKIRFVQALDIEITRLIVEICGGNPDKTPYLNSV
jgi:hypothetical protein